MVDPLGEGLESPVWSPAPRGVCAMPHSAAVGRRAGRQRKTLSLSGRRPPPARHLHAHPREQQRAQQVQARVARGQQPAAVLQHAHHLHREGGESGQRTQETGDDGQAPGRVELGLALEEHHGHAHQPGAQPVRSERAPGQQRVALVEPEAELPARERADGGTEADGDHLQHGSVGDQNGGSSSSPTAVTASCLGFAGAVASASGAAAPNAISPPSASISSGISLLSSPVVSATSVSKPLSPSSARSSNTPSRNASFLSCMDSVSTKPTRPSQLMGRRVGSLPSVMCLRTSSVARLWRVNFTTDFSSSPDLSSHSRSTAKPPGAPPSSSSDTGAEGHEVMAVCGVTWVCNRAAFRSLKALTSAVTSSSILPWLLASVTSQPLAWSIQTQAAVRRGKACGSSESSASSRSSFICFLPGLRPVVASMCSASSSAFSRTTEPGTALVSIISLSMRWPATDSTSGPWASPRGSTQPTDLSCVAPQGTKRAASSAASMVSSAGAQPGAMR